LLLLEVYPFLFSLLTVPNNILKLAGLVAKQKMPKDLLDFLTPIELLNILYNNWSEMLKTTEFTNTTEDGKYNPVLDQVSLATLILINRYRNAP
ncbi:MAG: hypothetical protein WCJ92_07540, partial [Alphaproteobacteria bacterium]